MSQSNLALYLGISVSAVKMIESGNRELPVSAAVKFAELQNFALVENNEVERLRNFEDTAPATVDRKAIQKQLHTLEEKLRRTTTQLDELQLHQQQIANRRALIAYIAEKGKGEADSKLWISMQEAEIAVLEDRWSKQKPLLLQWKIDSYRHSLELGKKLLNVEEASPDK